MLPKIQSPNSTHEVVRNTVGGPESVDEFRVLQRQEERLT